jgi:hypothetical protein
MLTISGGIASASVILTASASPNPVNVGGASTVTVTLSDNASANSVSGFQFDIDFSPSILQATSITEEGYFASNGVFGLTTATIDNTHGTITLIADAAGTPEDPGTGDPLVGIAFNAIGSGTSPITIANVIISNGQNSLSVIPDTARNTSVQVQTSSAVPEPGTGMLAVMGILTALSLLVGRRAWKS